MPGADEGGHSPTALHELLAEARDAGLPRARARSSHRSGTPRASPPSPVAWLPTAGPAPPGRSRLGWRAARASWWPTDWPEATVVLLEANGRRAAFLRRAVERLGLASRVTVLEERAEVCGRQEGLRGGFRRGPGPLLRPPGRGGRVCRTPPPRSGAGWSSRSRPTGRGRPTRRDRGHPGWPAEPPRASSAWSPSRWSTRASSTSTLRQAEPARTAFPGATGSRPRSPCSERPGLPETSRSRDSSVPVRGFPGRVPEPLQAACRRRVPRGTSAGPRQTSRSRGFTWNNPQLLTSGRRQARIGAVRRRFGVPT